MNGLVNQLIKSLQEVDTDTIIICLPPLITNSICFTKLLNVHFNKGKIIRIFEHVQRQWDASLSMRNKGELNILIEFTEKGRKLGQFYTYYIVSVMCLYLSMPLVPIFLDVVLPLNETRERIFLFEVDYNINNDKYFYPIYIHSAWSTCCTVLVIITVDSMYMMIVHHACGLFAILGYRIRNLVEEIKEDDDVDTDADIMEKLAYYKLRQCIIDHKTAIEFANYMEESSRISNLLQIGFNMLMISFTGVQTVIKMGQPEEVIRFGSFLIAQNIHLFFNSLPGQILTDHSIKLADTIYDAKWYKVSSKMRMLLMMMLVRCKIPCKMTAGKLYDMNLRNFSKVAQTSMSYFTVLTSLRE